MIVAFYLLFFLFIMAGMRGYFYIYDKIPLPRMRLTFVITSIFVGLMLIASIWTVSGT